MVFLPGIDGALALRQPFLEALSYAHDVTALELPEIPGSYEALAAALLPRLPPGRCVLVGESFSGPLAIALAAAVPERIAGLVLAATFARNPLPRVFRHGTVLIEHLPRRIYDFFLMGRNAPPATSAAVQDALARTPPALIRRRADLALTSDLRPALAALRCPVLVLHGSKDRLIRPALARESCRTARDGRTAWLTASHMLIETHPEAAADVVARFCGEAADGAQSHWSEGLGSA